MACIGNWGRHSLLGRLVWLIAAFCCARAPAVSNAAAQPHRMVSDLEGCWSLVRDPAHLSGPGVWERSPGTRCKRQRVVLGRLLFSSRPGRAAIHAGERVFLEDHSPYVQAYLGAVALDAGCIGESIRVRLTAGGATVHATVRGQGSAILEPGIGVRP
jgi:hypothetical protein